MTRARDIASGLGEESGEVVPHIKLDVLYPAVAGNDLDGIDGNLPENELIDLSLYHEMNITEDRILIQGNESDVSFEFKNGFCCRMKRINFLIRQVVSMA